MSTNRRQQLATAVRTPSWKCQRLVVGTGAHGRLPVMKEVKLEAERRKIELPIFPTGQAIEAVKQNPDDTNAVLHVTC